MTTTINPGESRITPLLIEREMRQSYLNYAMSVIYSRALPDVRDGLKPSQRRIFVAMNDLNLSPRAKYRKCAKIAGDTSGNYHPHGEAVIYPTLVRMAQPFSVRSILIEGQGNFGSIDGDPPAAMRYTEARMAGPAMELLEDLDYDTVDFKPNYDETRQEPVVLPGKFPNLLCNGSDGIAVGMATSLPPHNLGEIVDGILLLLENPNVSIDELMEKVPGPDFPTGAILCGTRGIRSAYRHGRGILTIRARTHIEELKGGKQIIVVTEIPFQQKKAAIIERIAECVKDGVIPGISDVQDHSDRDGIRFVVELKRGEETQVVLNQLYQHTPLQDSFSVINLSIVNGRPRVLSIKELMECYRDHRMDVVRRRTRFLQRKAEERLHILDGLKKAIDHIDEVIAIIKKSANTEEARRGLEAKFELDAVQSQAIVDMRLGRLTGLDRKKLEDEQAELRANIADCKDILAKETRVIEIIRNDLIDMKKKYADPRRTEIAGDIEDFNREDLIADEMMAVTVSRDGYIKRTALDTYRSQGRGGRGIIGSDTKEGDVLSHLFAASTHDYLLLFSDAGKVYWLKVFDLPLLGRTSKGRAINNLLSLPPEEKIESILPVKEFDEKRQIIFSTKKGLVKKTALSAYANPRRGGIIAIGLEEGDRLIGVDMTEGGESIVLCTTHGMAIRFPESDVRSMGRGAYGVKGITLKENDFVVDMVVAKEGATLLAACENGYGKRTALEEYRDQSRGGSGVINIRTTERNGNVVNLLTVTDEDDLMMVTEKGMIVRIKASSVRVMGRATQGVTLINLEDEDKLVAMERVVPEDKEAKPDGNGKEPPKTPTLTPLEKRAQEEE